MTTAITPQLPAHPAMAPMASRLVEVEALPWQAASYPGIEVKPLRFDRASGLASTVMRTAPGAVLPDHEHVLIEQTWMAPTRVGNARPNSSPGDPQAAATVRGHPTVDYCWLSFRLPTSSTRPMAA
jgi:anti-sigma factor ChrR (cupin superfamily)